MENSHIFESISFGDRLMF